MDRKWVSKNSILVVNGDAAAIEKTAQAVLSPTVL
jgi:hypothetical protein